MMFTKKNIDHSPISDGVFFAVDRAIKAAAKYGGENIINATIGTLSDEEGQLVALKTVFDSYNSLPDTSKAKYASSFSGNRDFQKRVYSWVMGDNELSGHSAVLATPGGSGAVSSCI